MSEEYIAQLEEEVERLHAALRCAQQILDDNWENSRTLGLIPGTDFIPLTDECSAEKYRAFRKLSKFKTWRSVRFIREFIQSVADDKKIVIRMIEDGENLSRIYKAASLLDGDHEPITNYTIEYAIVNDRFEV